MWVIAHSCALIRSQKFSVEVTPEKRAGEQSIHVLDKSNNILCVGSIRAWAVSRQNMSLMKSLLGIILLLLPVISAKECRLRADASEMLSVEYGVDPSGIRWGTHVHFCVRNTFCPGTQIRSQWRWRTDRSTACSCLRRAARGSPPSTSSTRERTKLNGRQRKH